MLSRLDYCTSLLVGLPQYLIKRLQGVQNAAARSILKIPSSKHISPLFQNLHWLPVNSRTLHKVTALCHSSISGSGPQYLSDLTHVYTPATSLHSSSDTGILSTPNVNLSHMVSVLFPTTVPLHGILCHSDSDINRNLIASSKLWKLICFLSINELNTNVVFFYFHLPIINTILVINNLTHLSYYINVITLLFSLCFAYGSLDTLVCALLNWVEVCYLIYFTICLFCVFLLFLIC